MAKIWTLHDAEEALAEAQSRVDWLRRRAYETLGWGTTEEIKADYEKLERAKKTLWLAQKRLEKLQKKDEI